MTNQQILKKAIEKVVKNGFKYAPYKVSDGVHPTIIEIPEISIYRHLLFSHSFAKALVKYIQKEKPKMFLDLLGDYKRSEWMEDEKLKKVQEAWEIGIAMRNFLQQMVLEEEPLKYLAKFLNGKPKNRT